MATQLAEAPAEVTAPPETVEQPAPERNYEAEARVHGWRPQEEFKGDPSGWVDAETFMKRADEVMPLLKKQNHALMAKITSLESAVKKLTKAEQAAYTNALADLKAQQEEAVALGDVEQHRAVSKKIDTLQASATQQAGQPTNEDVMAAWSAFRDENEWYDRADLRAASDQDMAMRAFADREMSKMAQVEKYDQGHSPEEFLAELKRRVEDRFPAGEARPRLRAVENVAGVTPRSVSRNAEVGANLPPEAKQQAERFIRMQIPGYTGLPKEKAYDLYAKSFDWKGYRA